MHFGHVALQTEILDAQGKNRVKICRVQQVEERTFRINAGNNGLASDFFTVSQDNTGHSTCLGANLADLGVCANLCSCSFGRFAQSTGEFAKSSKRESSRSYRIRVRSSTQEQNRGGTRRPWPKRAAKNSARRNDRPNQLGLEKFPYEVRHSHRAPAQEVENSCFAQAANTASELQQIPKIFGGRIINAGRSYGSNLIEHARRLV